MRLIPVTDEEGLSDLYNDSALTFEGLTIASIPDMLDWVRSITKFKTEEEKVYVVSGKMMNESYQLTGMNQYVPELNIVCVKLSDLENPLRLAIPRLMAGGKWFDDIVDNNARREKSLCREEY